MLYKCLIIYRNKICCRYFDRNLIIFFNNLFILSIIIQGKIDGVKFLIDRGADINTVNNAKKTLLHWAVGENHLDVVSMLIDYGMDDFELRDIRGRTVLHYAAILEHYEVLSKFTKLKNRISINSVDDLGETLLHRAIQIGSFDVVSYLLRYGADVNLVALNGKNSLLYAIEHKRLDMIDFLINCHADYRVVDVNGCSTLHYAAKYDNAPLMIKLLDKKANPRLTDKHLQTSVFYAVEENCVKILEILYDYVPDTLKGVNDQGWNLLHIAASAGNVDVLKVLLRYHPDLTQIADLEGYLPIHRAI